MYGVGYKKRFTDCFSQKNITENLQVINIIINFAAEFITHKEVGLITMNYGNNGKSEIHLEETTRKV